MNINTILVGFCNFLQNYVEIILYSTLSCWINQGLVYKSRLGVVEISYINSSLYGSYVLNSN